ncbi:MAG TPA: LD-carboxypeptidase [Marmoricola sp.]|jgi:muramoyltetrapeptide carboxypeptidase
MSASKARAMQPGATIGVPAPASPYTNRSELLRGVEWWERQGYRVKLADGIHAREAYIAGDAVSRARDLTAMFADDEVEVVHAFQGGYGSAQTIPHVDWSVVRANPKPFVGYSDITALHLAMRHFADLVTFYGPTLGDIDHPDSNDYNKQNLLRALTSTEPLGPVPPRPKDDYLRALAPGRVSGEIVGGCLWLIGQTIGTPWQPDLAGRIFFFEDVDAPPWYLDGLLNQMTQAGMLDDVVGVVVGEMVKCDWRESRPEWPQTFSLEDVLERYLEPLGVPVLYRLPLGHGDYLATLPLGVQVTLDADARSLTVDETALLP